MLNKKIIRASGIIATILLFAILWIDQDMIFVKTIRIVFGSIFILFLPGFFLTVNFFNKKEIDWLERFALSFALSISVVPLITFYVNLLGVKISQINVYITVCIIIAMNIGYYYLPEKFKLKNKKHEMDK